MPFPGTKRWSWVPTTPRPSGSWNPVPRAMSSTRGSNGPSPKPRTSKAVGQNLQVQTCVTVVQQLLLFCVRFCPYFLFFNCSFCQKISKNSAGQDVITFEFQLAPIPRPGGLIRDFLAVFDGYRPSNFSIMMQLDPDCALYFSWTEVHGSKESWRLSFDGGSISISFDYWLIWV